MNDIMIPAQEQDGKILVSARDLREALGIRTNYSTWIERIINDFDFIENTDFITRFPNLESDTGGQNRRDHYLTIEMAKEICMITRNGNGKKVRKYFINLEKKWNTPDQILSRALKLVDSYITNAESRPSLETASNEELIKELQRRLA